MALVHDDEIKEIPWILPVQAWTALVFCDGLINCKVHLPALDRLGLNLVSRLAERREDLVLWVINQHIPVSQIKDTRAAVLAGTVPSGIRELPANLKCNNC